MNTQIKEALKDIWKFLTNRLLWMIILTCGLFYILLARLFYLQIVRGEIIEVAVEKKTTEQSIYTQAPRGLIFDRYGRPLAVNEVAHSLKMDNTFALSNAEYNNMYLTLIEILHRNDETVYDNLPISDDNPRQFLFNGSKTKEKNWKRDLGYFGEDQNRTADEIYDQLLKDFKIPEELTKKQERELLSFRCATFLKRFDRTSPTIVSPFIKDSTLAEVEERNQELPGIYVEIDSTRHYPYGENFSHMLGYIRAINEDELSAYKAYGYTNDSIIGKLGIEKAMELELKGKQGETVVEVDSKGRRISLISKKEAEQGNRVYLTIDAQFQNFAADVLERVLTEVLVNKIETQSTKDRLITIKEVFSGMIMSNNISIAKIMDSSEDDKQYEISQLVMDEYRELNGDLDIDITSDDGAAFAKQSICNFIDSGVITPKQMAIVLYEQGIITLDDDSFERLSNGLLSPSALIKQKLTEGEITPQMTNLDPCTGSITVTDVKTGEILALVTYPTYDNNMLVNTFQYDYYKTLLMDPTLPLTNRPLLERRAPGSTFKMVSAVAGLSSGVISTSNTIQDLGVYTKVGVPYARCHIYTSSHTTHGYVDVSEAIKVSCNYYFYEMAYRLAEMEPSNKNAAIETLNKYMEYFGLTDYTGVEIEETKPLAATPENKERITLQQNPDATQSQMRWTNGDTIRAAIGQSINSYTTTNMAKYMATLANGGTRYQSHLVNKITSYNGEFVEYVQPNIESAIDIAPEDLKAVFEGMLAVTESGTAAKAFDGLPMKVAGKTGTAQEASYRPNHTWFTCFAPYDDPQIAIAIALPYGESSLTPAPFIARYLISEYFGYNDFDIKSADGTLLR